MNVPIGLINSSYGGSQAEAWTPRDYLAASRDLETCIAREQIWVAERPQVQQAYDHSIEKWEREVEKAENNGTVPPRRPRVPDALRDYRIAGSIYQHMIDPLIPYAIKGALWYQGESNEERAEQYMLLLETMIKSWRDRWNQGDFPFGIIQLPNFRSVSGQPEDKAWSHLRESQRIVYTRTENTGLIVTIDLGEADDIHPTNKQDVGKRSAIWALADIYGQGSVSTGPQLAKVKHKKKNIVLTFDQVGSGLKTRDDHQLSEFAIAVVPGQWQWAKARIKGKEKVVVWHEDLVHPQSVRYAFNRNPINPNLVNSRDLPAAPFRTDDWKDPTSGIK